MLKLAWRIKALAIQSSTLYTMNNYHQPGRYILICFFAICAFSSCEDSTETLSFKGCRATYTKFANGKHKLWAGHYLTNDMELEQAQRKLASCLCDKYLVTKDTAIRDKIIELYNEKETYYTPSEEITTNNFDSIMTHRHELFDTTMLID